MSHLLISRIIHDKFYFVVFVHLQEFGKHRQVFENDLVGAKYEICEGLKAWSVSGTTQVNILYWDCEGVCVDKVLKAEFYLEHLLCSCADAWSECDKTSSSLDHIVNF